MKKKILYILVALAMTNLGMGSYPDESSQPTGSEIAAAAAGVIYYVDNTNPSCSDTLNNGLASSTPFCTIGHASNLADAGITVSVLAGTYAETVKPNANGVAGSPITYSAAPGVVVTGEAGNAANGGGFRLYGKNYIVIDGFTITGTADYGIIATSSTFITISNNHVSYSGTAVSAGLRPGIYLTATTNSILTGNITDHNTSDGIRLNNGSNNNWIEKNISFGNATQISNQAAGIDLLKNSSYNTILRNTTYANEDTGLNFYTGSGYNNVINNLTYGNGDHGIDNSGAPYNTFIGNTVQGNVTVGINLEADSTGAGSGGAVLMNNIFVDNGYRRYVGGATFNTSNPGNVRVDTTSITSPAATTLDYNMIYSAPVYTGIQITWGITFPSLAAFQATGQEAHGLQADPLFSAPAPIAERPLAAPFNMAVNPGNYHITTGSPAVDSANSAAPYEQTVDFDGKPRVDIPEVANTGAGTRAYDDRGVYELQPKVAQTISFVTPAPANALNEGPTYTPFATATSGLAVTITVDVSASVVCSINAGLVSFIGAGTCVLNADQAGDSNYLPAPQVKQTFKVGKAKQTITITTPAPANAAKGSLFTVAASGGGSGNPVVYSSSGACTNSGAVFTMTGGSGTTCTVYYNQAGNANFTAAPVVTEDVHGKRYAQTITVTTHAPASAAYPSSFTVAAVASSGLAVEYSSSGICTNALGVFTMTGAFGTCYVHYNQSGDSDYALAAEIIEVVYGGFQAQSVYLPLVLRGD